MTTTKAMHKHSMPSTLRAALWGGLLCIYAIPIIAKAIGPNMLWTASDFVVAGVGLVVLGLLIEGVFRITDNWAYRAAAIGTVLTSFLLAWITLAVGFLGKEDNPLNLLYLAMLSVVVIAGAAFRFRAQAMAALMLFCAASQMLMLLIDEQEMGFEWIATGIFCLIWLALAALFRQSSRA